MNMVVGITESTGVNTEWLLDTFMPMRKSLSETALFELVESEIKQTTSQCQIILIVTPWFWASDVRVTTQPHDPPFLIYRISIAAPI